MRPGPGSALPDEDVAALEEQLEGHQVGEGAVHGQEEQHPRPILDPRHHVVGHLRAQACRGGVGACPGCSHSQGPEGPACVT